MPITRSKIIIFEFRKKFELCVSSTMIYKKSTKWVGPTPPPYRLYAREIVTAVVPNAMSSFQVRILGMVNQLLRICFVPVLFYVSMHSN